MLPCCHAALLPCCPVTLLPQVLLPLLSHLPEVEREQQPLLFACENDHGAVKTLQRELAGKVHVIDCMVDRVCTGRTIEDGGVDVAAEPWRGSIVVLEPQLKERVPFCSAVATVPSTEREAEYLSERKFTLVNGMHTVLAFMTLEALYVPEAAESATDREYVLLKYDRMRRAAQRTVEAWRAARVAQLLETFGEANLMAWHGCETREEAWEVLLAFSDHVLSDRFSQVDDVVSRVLGGGVANRWLTRLRPTARWMEGRAQAAAEGATVDAAESHADFFLYALRRDRHRALEGRREGVEPPLESAAEAERQVREICSELTLASRRFCSKETEITHKALIREQRKSGGKFKSPTVQRALQLEKETQ